MLCNQVLKIFSKRRNNNQEGEKKGDKKDEPGWSTNLVVEPTLHSNVETLTTLFTFNGQRTTTELSDKVRICKIMNCICIEMWQQTTKKKINDGLLKDVLC